MLIIIYLASVVVTMPVACEDSFNDIVHEILLIRDVTGHQCIELIAL